MKILKVKSLELNWNLDFKPLTKWPAYLPILAASRDEKLWVLAGFERKTQIELDVLVLNASLEQIWPIDYLKTFERLRFLEKLDLLKQNKALLEFPLTFQNYLDSKDVSLKNLRPLEHLTEWKENLNKLLTDFSPTASQCREAFDILCDLKLQNHEYPNPESNESFDSWFKKLKILRYPKTTAIDQNAGDAVEHLSWPKGVRAKWERQGDEGFIKLEAALHSPLEWQRFCENIQKIDLKENLWN